MAIKKIGHDKKKFILVLTNMLAVRIINPEAERGFYLSRLLHPPLVVCAVLPGRAFFVSASLGA